MCEEPHQFDLRRQEQLVGHSLDSSTDNEPLRMAGLEPRLQANSNDFRLEVPEFEGKLDTK